ncbi:DUF3800 domain-containing protein [Mycoplasmatota bacterium]|nr:DUF3800 domain-containing protein [Mycoplasmatota bacterium]
MFLVLDESGTFSNKKQRYYIIGGYLTNDLNKVKSIHRKKEAIIKRRKKIPLKANVEFKAHRLLPNDQAMFINAITEESNIHPVAIIVDKNSIQNEISENGAYFIYLKLLIKKVINQFNLKDCNLEILLDNRTFNEKHKNEFLLETKYFYDGRLSLEFLESHHKREIQVADYIANFLYVKYNKDEQKYKTRIKNLDKFFIVII